MKVNNIHRMAEASLISLLQKHVSLNILKMVDVLFVDEIGQVSSEMITCLDMILRRIKKNNIFLGGVLFICTLDHKQLQPITGKPFLMTPMIISCFRLHNITESVRASGDLNLQRMQKIARMNPSKYSSNPELLSEFKELLSSTCTFIDD